ncbi:hypothetical protein Tco_0587532 [Tanacetum coccineum]
MFTSTSNAQKKGIGIAVADATDVARARGASDIRVNDEPALRRVDIGLSVIVSAVLTSRAIFPIYAVTILIRIVLGFMLIALIWKFDFSPFIVLIIAILNDGTIMTISKDKVKPQHYQSGTHFVTRSRSWLFIERPGLLLLFAFFVAQPIATLIAVIWLYSIYHTKGKGGREATTGEKQVYNPLDIFKFIIHYALSGKAWDNMLEKRTAFTSKKDYGRGEREAQWATDQRTLHGLQAPNTNKILKDKTDYRELYELAEQAKRRAEVARSRELRTLKGHVESVVKLKGLDIETIQQYYTV